MAFGILYDFLLHRIGLRRGLSLSAFRPTRYSRMTVLGHVGLADSRLPYAADNFSDGQDFASRSCQSSRGKTRVIGIQCQTQKVQTCKNKTHCSVCNRNVCSELCTRDSAKACGNRLQQPGLTADSPQHKGRWYNRKQASMTVSPC